MKQQQQRFLNSSSSPSSNEGSDPYDKFRLGSSAAHHHRHRDFCGRVIFSDPCARCGNKKRRRLTVEDSAPELSASVLPTPPPPSSPADIFRRWNSCPASSPSTAPLPPPDPASMLRSFSDVTPAPTRRLLRWNPASVASGRLISPTFLMSSHSQGRSPDQRWKRAEDMKKWVFSVAEDEQKDDFAPLELGNDINNNENRVGEENAERESELGSDTVTFLHKCNCGKQFQFFVLAKPV